MLKIKNFLIHIFAHLFFAILNPFAQYLLDNNDETINLLQTEDFYFSKVQIMLQPFEN